MTSDSSLPTVDAHCHIDLYPHPERIITLAEEQHIYTIAVTNAPSVFPHTANLTTGCKYVRPALGLHPELVHSHSHEIEQFRALLPQTRYVGEVGLDYTTNDDAIRLAQRQVLEAIAAGVNESGDKVMTLHSRRSASDVMSVLSGVKAQMILHWFSGTNKELDRAINSGYHFSVNGAMTRSARGRALILRMPRDRVLTETDGPFVKDGNLPATPASIRATLADLAELWGEPLHEVQLRTIENLKRLLSARM